MAQAHSLEELWGQKEQNARDFLGGPKAKIPHFQSRGPRFDQVVSLDLEKASLGVNFHRHGLTTSVGLKYFQSQKMSEENVDFLTYGQMLVSKCREEEGGLPW